MRHLIDAVRRSVQEQNWYASLATALALPDISGYLDTGSDRSQARYVLWFDTYLAPKYTHVIGSGRTHVFLTGQDCYALRCAYLYQGDFDITGQRAQSILDSFEFTFPSVNNIQGHMNQRDARLQLQVSNFCEEICISVEMWLQARENDPVVSARIASLPLVTSFSGRI